MWLILVINCVHSFFFTGESISKDVPNLRVSKYDSYIRKLKAGQSINKIIGRKVSASQRIRDIISQQIQLKQGGGSGHEGEAGSKEGVDAEAIEAAILESEGLAQREFAAAASAAAAAAAAAASASDPQLHLDPQRSSNYEYFMSKFNKGEALPRYSLGDGVASTSSNSSTSAISPPPGMDDSSIDDPQDGETGWLRRDGRLQRVLRTQRQHPQEVSPGDWEEWSGFRGGQWEGDQVRHSVDVV